MARISKRQIELEEFVHDLDLISVIDACSKFIGIPISAVMDRMKQLTDNDIDYAHVEFVELVFSDGIEASNFIIWARRLELASEFVTRQYLHFSDDYLNEIKFSRNLKISRITIQVDESDRVEEVVLRINERANLIEGLSQFYQETSVGLGMSGALAVPTIEFKLTSGAGVSLPAFILDPAYKSHFNVRIYSIGDSNYDVTNAQSLVNSLRDGVSLYPVRKSK